MNKITLKNAIGLFRAIDELKASKPNLDFQVWYNLSKVQSSLRPAMESYELKYNELINKYADKDGDGKNKMLPTNPPRVQMTNTDQFKEDLEKLDQEKVPVKIDKIDKKEFKGVKMEGSENMFSLFDHVIK